HPCARGVTNAAGRARRKIGWRVKVRATGRRRFTRGVSRDAKRRNARGLSPFVAGEAPFYHLVMRLRGPMARFGWRTIGWSAIGIGQLGVLPGCGSESVAAGSMPLGETC